MCKADKSINRRCFGFLMSLLICLLLAGALPAASAESIEENEYGYIDAVLDSRNGIPEDAEGRLALIRETGVLRVATEPYFAPQEYIDPSQYGQARYVGSDMELARMIAERMGVSLEIVPMKFTRLLPSLALGDCDLAISAISYTPERADQYTLSMGYCVSEKAEGSGIMIRTEDRDDIRSLEDLEGKDLAAKRGTLQESLLADSVFHYRQFRRQITVREVYLALQRGKADAAMVDIASAQSYIDSNPNCGLMLVPGLRFNQEEAFRGDRVAARKGETQLIAFVNDVIQEVSDSGQYGRWYRQHALNADWLGI